MKQTILVTGASSGFGLLVANELHKRGIANDKFYHHRVFTDKQSK